ncbi:hypothetical protein PIB30_079273 [Stylosanthes scabra]|uniref:Uncharacterized protein n=1 Tax=Stylosanthes scabra TaxID=79078 RepID=A0ABU6TT05_9FABA|nr:hypothetical protein [Stylosanthes scabra]
MAGSTLQSDFEMGSVPTPQTQSVAASTPTESTREGDQLQLQMLLCKQILSQARQKNWIKRLEKQESREEKRRRKTEKFAAGQLTPRRGLSPLTTPRCDSHSQSSSSLTPRLLS